MANLRDERAQVMVETAIAFPIQMVVTLAIMQYCLIAGSKQVLTYASHMAGRAAIVGMDYHKAASIICSPIAGGYDPPGSAPTIHIPGWGDLKGSANSQLKTRVFLDNPPDDGDKKVTVRLEFDLELIIPFVEWTPFVDWHVLWGDVVKLGPNGVVHKVMTQEMTIPQPWDGDTDGVVGRGIIPDLGD